MRIDMCLGELDVAPSSLDVSHRRVLFYTVFASKKQERIQAKSSGYLLISFNIFSRRKMFTFV
jgi:hypothetical protein